MNEKRKEYTYTEYEECMIAIYKNAVDYGDFKDCKSLQERIDKLIESYPIYHNQEVAEMLKNDLSLGNEAEEYIHEGFDDVFKIIRMAVEARLSNKLNEIYSNPQETNNG